MRLPHRVLDCSWLMCRVTASRCRLRPRLGLSHACVLGSSFSYSVRPLDVCCVDVIGAWAVLVACLFCSLCKLIERWAPLAGGALAAVAGDLASVGSALYLPLFQGRLYSVKTPARRGLCARIRWCHNLSSLSLRDV